MAKRNLEARIVALEEKINPPQFDWGAYYDRLREAEVEMELSVGRPPEVTEEDLRARVDAGDPGGRDEFIEKMKQWSRDSSIPGHWKK
ncbi:MAG TPA: hypothetical protein PKV94_07735 [Syntrophales bacterium]|jgi:hypothetical protein|nr:hypothetical protein [Syntrophales bacterium]HPN24880.1 hypothetical protein [Syntrophales bacterium]